MFTTASNKPSQSFKCNHVEVPSKDLLLVESGYFKLREGSFEVFTLVPCPRGELLAEGQAADPDRGGGAHEVLAGGRHRGGGQDDVSSEYDMTNM